MSLTKGARQLLAFLRSKGGVTNRGCWWKQGNIAKDLGVHRSSVSRWMAELRNAGEVQDERRGSTSNRCFCRPEETQQMQLPFADITGEIIMEVLRKTIVKPVDIAVEGLRIKTEMRQQMSQIATTLHNTEVSTLKRKAGLAQLPPPTITHPAGRVEPNPEYRRIVEILQKAAPRIRKADNPAAYEQAIIRQELAREWGARHGAQGYPATGKRRPVETPCVPLADEVTSESISGGVAATVTVRPPTSPGVGKPGNPPASAAQEIGGSNPSSRNQKTPRKPPDREWVNGYLHAVNALAFSKSFGRSP